MVLLLAVTSALLICFGNCHPPDPTVLTTTEQPTTAPTASQPTCPTNQSTTEELSSNPCADIQRANVSQSGYYWIPDGNGAAVKLYCKLHSSSCCGITGSWLRVGYLDMKNVSHVCPSGFQLYNSPRRCGLRIARAERYHLQYYGWQTRYEYDNAGCSQITYPTYTTRYQRVCGRITAYQKGTTDAFYNHYSRNSSITSTYVDGVSITHGSLKHHIWTFAAASDELRADQWRCPCSRCDRKFTGRVPPYIGNDYFCDSGTLIFPNPNQVYTANPIWDGSGCAHTSTCCEINSPPWFCKKDSGTLIFPNPNQVYTANPIWDGSGCAHTSTCCEINSPPWFCKKLPQPTTDNIEVRVCRDQRGGDEDIQISLIEIYIA